jgi:hypothetical protein
LSVHDFVFKNNNGVRIPDRCFQQTFCILRQLENVILFYFVGGGSTSADQGLTTLRPGMDPYQAV